MTLPVSVNAYAVSTGTAPNTGTVAFVSTVSPGSNNISGPNGPFKIGQVWIDTTALVAYILVALTTSSGRVSATWALSAGGPGTLSTLTGTTGGAISPVGGNISILGGAGVSVAGSAGTLTINLTGGGVAIDSFAPDAGTNPVVPDGAGLVTMAGTANQITTTGGLNTLTFSLPSAITAPGSLTTTTSLSATTTVTAGTGITATTGNIVATAGQVNSGTTMTAGTGITATSGNIVATLGQVNAGTTMTAGTGITATTGNIVASAGAVNAGTTMTAGTGITATTGNIVATAGAVTAGTTMTAGTGLTVTTGDLAVSAGNANITGNVVASKSSAGANVTAQVTNSDNTSGTSNSGVEIATGGASGGDPYLSFQISGVAASTMTMGLDNSASDLFVISNSTTIGTSNALTLSQAGALNSTTSITAGTSMTATLGNITATNGNLVMGTAGNKIIVPTGANASAGTSDAMSGTPGAVTVATTASSATAKIFYCRNVTGGTPGEISITAQDGTGFTLTSTGNETSTFNWWIINA